jgi:iron complex transport system ATP-binding protein
MIEAVNLNVHLGRKHIVKNVNFEAHPGAVTAIIGQNGSGKTTLLRALSGEISGVKTVSINGSNLAKMSELELAKIRAVLPQSTNLTFPFTVHEVVKLGAINGPKLIRDWKSDLTNRALMAVGLGDYGNRFFQELSGGEQQRVQMARVLAQVWEPEVGGVPRWLFLDEPVSSLDLKHQISIMNIARDFANQGGGVVAVMHDLNLTAMYADKVYVMQHGAALANGPIGAVLTNQILSRAYECQFDVSTVPTGGRPYVLPHGVLVDANSRQGMR